MKKLTKKSKKELYFDLCEYICMYFKHEYEDEEEFEEKFGPMDTLEDASRILRKHISNTQDMYLFEVYMKEFPGSKDELLEIFGVDEGYIKEDGKETITITKSELRKLVSHTRGAISFGWENFPDATDEDCQRQAEGILGDASHAIESVARKYSL